MEKPPSDNPHESAAAEHKTVGASQKESHARSALKAFSWRILATATTTIIAYIMTGTASTALKIGGIEFFAKMPVYYLHERAWQLVPRGAVRRLLHRNRPK